MYGMISSFYTDNNFSYDEAENQWIAKHQKYPDFQAISKGYILGLQKWTIHNDSHSILCSETTSYTIRLSLSSCTMEQFTCSDGNCVDMDKR